MFGFKKEQSDNANTKNSKEGSKDAAATDATQESIPSSISQCEKLVRNIFENSSDIIIQSFETKKEKAMIVYVDGLTNKDLMDRDIIAPIKSESFDGNVSLAIKTHFQEVNDIPTFVGEVLQGNTALFYEGNKKILSVDIRQWDKRTVEQPDTNGLARAAARFCGFYISRIKPGCIFNGSTVFRNNNISSIFIVAEAECKY